MERINIRLDYLRDKVLLSKVNSMVSKLNCRPGINSKINTWIIKEIMNNPYDYNYAEMEAYVKNNKCPMEFDYERLKKTHTYSPSKISLPHHYTPLLQWFKRNDIPYKCNNNYYYDTSIRANDIMVIQNIMAYIIYHDDILERIIKDLNFDMDQETFFKALGQVSKIYSDRKNNEEFTDSIKEIFGEDLSIFDKISEDLPRQ